MKVYPDDNIAGHRLVAMLRKAGHEVVVPSDAGQSGVSDARHLKYALENGLLLLSQDYEDFRDLHQLIIASGGGHPGILLVYSENDPTRDLTSRGIVTAVGKLEASQAPLANEVHVLNVWR